MIIEKLRRKLRDWIIKYGDDERAPFALMYKGTEENMVNRFDEMLKKSFSSIDKNRLYKQFISGKECSKI